VNLNALKTTVTIIIPIVLGNHFADQQRTFWMYYFLVGVTLKAQPNLTSRVLPAALTPLRGEALVV